MKELHRNKLSLFDAAFFKFSFSIMIKKTSVYLSSLLYFLLVLFCTTVVPAIAEVAPIDIFAMPTTAMFMMFCASIVASFIAIEIFRTSIDDGTELLTVSKPISRKEIVFVKLVIFLIYILVISIISTAIASFMFSTGLGSANDNAIILIGILLASIINGIIFGSIATILSLYCKKIISLLITISISFTLIVFSLLGSFVVKSPTKLMQNDDVSIVPLSSISPKLVDEDKNGVFEGKLDFVEGIVVPDKSSILSGGSTAARQQQTPEQVWTKYKNQSGYKTFAYFDVGYQLSSLYTLSKQGSTIEEAITRMTAFNSPVDFIFYDYDLNAIVDTPVIEDSNTVSENNNNNNQDYFAKINIGFTSTPKNLPNDIEQVLKDNLPHFGIGLNATSSSRLDNDKYPKNNAYVDFTNYQLQNEVKKINTKKELTWDYVWSEKKYTVSTDWEKYPDIKQDTEMTMRDYLDKYVSDYYNYQDQLEALEKDPNSQQEIKRVPVINLGQMFVKEYFEEEIISKKSDVILNDLNQIILSGFYKMAYEKDGTPKFIPISSIFDVWNDIDQDLKFSEIFKAYKKGEEGDPLGKPLSIEIDGKPATGYDLIDKLMGKTTTGNTTWKEVVEQIDKNQLLAQQLKGNLKHRNEYRTFLRLIGNNYASSITPDNSDLTGYLMPNSAYPKKLDFIGFNERIVFSYFVPDANGEMILNSNTTYRPKITSYLTNLANNFQKIEITYILNRDAVIAVWVIVAIVIFIITAALYSRRDFA